MRNLKRVLALALAVIMMIGMMVTASAAYSDADQIDPAYAEAVEVLTGMGVFKGDDLGAFGAKDILTREQAAALIYRVVTADVKDAQKDLYDYTSFADVIEGYWSTGYITYSANAGFIKGYNGYFNPADDVTGIQTLAMLLRAMGYGKNGEYEGEGWKDHVLYDARETKLTAGIKTDDLDKGATREMVAQMIFNAQKPLEDGENDMVTWNILWDYQNTGKTLGEKEFNLKGADTEDKWGRPAYEWTYKTGNKATKIAEEPAYATNVMVDECDIAKALDLAKDADIVSYWLNGEEETKAADMPYDADIELKGTKDYVGAQGRLVEVYVEKEAAGKAPAELRIVEIDTYLGNVTTVTDEKTDKNGHVTPATIEVTAYTQNGDVEELEYETDGFKKGDYVLVAMTGNKKADYVVQAVEAAEVVDGGELTDWDNNRDPKANTTEIEDEDTYEDAVQFVLNYRKDGDWNVALDQYGNIIGLIDIKAADPQYLVIENIEIDDGRKADFAWADIVLADGTSVKDAKIVEINGEDVTDADDEGDPAKGTVADTVKLNGAYEKHIFAYTEKDGEYSIEAVTAVNKDCTDHEIAAKGYAVYCTTKDVWVYNGEPTVENVNEIVATRNTVYLIWNAKSKSYDVYTGKANVPDGEASAMCAVIDKKGYADLIVLQGFTDADSEFVAYVASDYEYGRNKYGVYKFGETDLTKLTEATSADFEADFEDAGFYTITLDAKGKFDSMVAFEMPGKVNGADVDELEVKAEENNGSIQMVGEDFNVDEDTVVIFVEKGELSVEALEDIDAGDKVVISYKKSNASVIYVFI